MKDNFLRVNNVMDVNAMYGKEVYVTIHPDKPEEHFIYKGTLLGYGAYGKNPERKTFCVYIDRGDDYSFIDYFQDECFRSKEDYEEFKQKRKGSRLRTVDWLRRALIGEEGHIDVKVKIGNIVYPIVGVVDPAISAAEPAFILKVDEERGEE